MVAATLAGLKHSGRFAEIGKRDIWSPARIAQGKCILGKICLVLYTGGCCSLTESSLRSGAAERPDVQYSLVAIDFLPPSVLNASMRQVASMLAGARVAPLQHLAYDFPDAIAAFRQFTHAQHIGKIVLRVPPPAETAQTAGGSWTVSGGLGALGALAAEWLVAQGHGQLMLLGRSGRCAEEG